jgi:hypothetical protein
MTRLTVSPGQADCRHFVYFIASPGGRELVDFRLAADHSDNNQRTLKTIYLGNRCSIRLSYGTKRRISVLGTF